MKKKMVLQTGAFLGTTKKIFVGISTECLPVFWGTSPDTPSHSECERNLFGSGD